MAHRTACRLILLSALSLLLSLVAAPSSSAEQWTDISGTRTMEAELLGMWGDQAIFQKPDGSRVAVPLNQLQAESRIRAQERARELTQSRAARIAELAQAAQAELAPAPAELPPPPEAPAYQPLPAGADLQQTVQHVDAQTRNGHLRALWDALPNKYQSDLEDLVVQFAGKMDPQLWQTQMGAVRRVIDLLASRQNWVLSHPMVAAVAAQTDDAPQQMYAPLLGVAKELTVPQAVSLQRLKQGDLSQLIAERDEAIAGYVHQLQTIGRAISGAPEPQLEVKMIDETHGTVTWRPPAQPAPPSGQVPQQPPGGPRPAAFPSPQPMTLVLVDGRWVPEAIAKNWDANIEAAKKKIDALPESMDAYRKVVASLVLGIDRFVAPLENAKTREQFHAEMDQLVGVATMAVLPFLSGNARLLPGGNPRQQPGGLQLPGSEFLPN